ncbi:histidine phosphatase family protein [Gryllotalpicola protaetiae]|uniref:Histidine phosphatase family protein n=1 Tax=Gryllotalpicola protaetiae TaxID=2419771 RepID=A0A387BUZ2_9MICO|nr:histidine phosphatase family protein [Gryllotalpicola protaetiae]AYG04906.1 histidine phosphatase family protein [Gryllotalpicola protaetiae]
MRLLLIRHGQTPANVAGALDTAAPGPGLTELGEQQSLAVPHALRDENVQGIYASRLVRTQLTAAPLSRSLALDVVVHDGLHEIEAGALEARTDDDSVKAYLGTIIKWGTGELDARMPGAFDGHEFFGRFDAAITQVAETHDDTAAVFSHGAAIRAWVGARALNVSGEFTLKNPIDNTGVAVLEGSLTHGWELVSWAGTPVGGEQLADQFAVDPTGERVE